MLAYQRYGRGKAIAMPIQDSWAWRMDAKVAVNDTTHAMFWRRMVRWLVDGVPEQVNLTTTATIASSPAKPIKLHGRGPRHRVRRGERRRVVAHITSPSGKTTEVPIEWTVEHDGEYGAVFDPDESGLYDDPRHRDARSEGARHQRDARARVGRRREYFDAAMRAPLLKRIAEDTGGRFFTPANASSLPEAISYSGRGVTVVEERELWDMPALLLLLLAWSAAEWGYRRMRGLA